MTARLVVVSAGTYHLPFDRLSDWAERWLQSNPGVDLVMQHGPSRPVADAENVTILPYERLISLCARADVVVLQGGAGGVMDMRALGVVPVVVPRVPGGGEVVDDHQLVFTAEMEALGLVRRALTYDEFHRLMKDGTAGQLSGIGAADVATPGVAKVRNLLEAGSIHRISLATTSVRICATAARLVCSRLGRIRRVFR